MSDEVVEQTPPPAPPPTLIEVLRAKLAAAKTLEAEAIAKCKEIETEIEAIPSHLHLLSWEQLKLKVESWFS